MAISEAIITARLKVFFIIKRAYWQALCVKKSVTLISYEKRFLMLLTLALLNNPENRKRFYNMVSMHKTASLIVFSSTQPLRG